ncbi:MAG TPA: HAD-IA family hydrolase [Candidatus Polarisedimenticolia bacterium]|nr:HAD-IA family hydrolase [Candidatus Polarisedimenticolia bacterium]
MTVEAVFFDVGGTLVEVSPSIGHVYAAACAARGAAVEAPALQRAFDAAWVALSAEVPPGRDRYALFDGGERGWWERVCGHAFDACGVPAGRRPPVDELRDAFARPEAWRIYPEVREVLDRLRGLGLRLGVISNWDSRLPALLDVLGLTGWFESLVYSAAAGYEKPHAAIFGAALASLGVDPSRAVHIGDRLEEDYSGARAVGMRAILVDRSAGRERSMAAGPLGDARHVVADLRPAVALIAP